MNNWISKKLKSNIGESLSEVLIAGLIASLGMLLFAMMISSSSKIITNSNNAFIKYYGTDISNLETKSVTQESNTITINDTTKRNVNWYSSNGLNRYEVED